MEKASERNRIDLRSAGESRLSPDSCPPGKLASVTSIPLSCRPFAALEVNCMRGSSVRHAKMVLSTGQERALSEYVRLFDAAGFAPDRVTESPAGQSVAEAVLVLPDRQKSQ